MNVKWAKNEITLIKEQTKEEEIKAYYDDALRVYHFLRKKCNEDGLKENIVLDTVHRLIKGKVLTPITDDDEWDVTDNGVKYCVRYPLLTRTPTSYGYSYSDPKRTIGIDLDSGIKYRDGLTNDIADEIFPIVLPYKPGMRGVVVTTSELSTEDDELYDTVAVWTVRSGNEERTIERFFADKGDEKYTEISREEYEQRAKEGC